MTWGAVAGAAVGVVGGMMTSGDAGDAAQTAASADMAALDYIKEIEKLPLEMRDKAMEQMAGFYGLPGYEGGGEALIQRAQESPYFSAMQGAGEEAILRQAGATGGLRSGNVQSNLAKYNQQLLSDAVDRQLSGLSGFAGFQPDARAGAGYISSAGDAMSQGELAQAQIKANMLGDMGTLVKEGVNYAVTKKKPEGWV